LEMGASNVMNIYDVKLIVKLFHASVSVLIHTLGRRDDIELYSGVTKSQYEKVILGLEDDWKKGKIV